MQRLAIVAVLAVTASYVVAAPKLKPTRGVTKIAIDYRHVSFRSSEKSYVVTWTDGGYRTADDKPVVAAAIEGLYAALTNLRPSANELRCISHTDDYPHLTITVDGDRPLVLRSDSNCHHWIPWNVTVDGKQQAQFTEAVGHAVYLLLAAVDPWWAGRERDDGGDIGHVRMGEYAPGDTGSDAAACARDFESSKTVAQLLGVAPRVSELTLSCFLLRSPDCTRTTASVEFPWDGVQATIEVPCNGAKVELAKPIATSITAMRAFLASKPARALVKVAKQAPRFWTVGSDWRLESMDLDQPGLTLEEGEKVIELQLYGDGALASAFWKELGLDAKKLTRREDGRYVTGAKLDFSGKLHK